MITFATVVLPEPVPPAMPITRGGVRFGMLELYWNKEQMVDDYKLDVLGLSTNTATPRLPVSEPPKGIEPLT